MPLVVLAVLLAPLVAVPAPNGGAVQADAALVPALTILASLGDGGPLVQAFADTGIRVRVAPLAADAIAEPYAEFDLRARTVTVSPEIAALEAATVAAILAHAGSHVRAMFDGTAAREREQFGPVAACQADEWRAVVTELGVWQALHGTEGKARPVDDYEASLNEDLALYRQNPGQLRAELAEDYAAPCAAFGPRAGFIRPRLEGLASRMNPGRAPGSYSGRLIRSRPVPTRMNPGRATRKIRSRPLSL